ncbi:DNA-binding SARP family transcriptional activator [Catenuloplanes nepalensis]|uniref:DNA-binding SARP family transcriptional activator n=1 Tax=Catenuloplanes nepalensis TaxID=587533 RepID=A0ABT9MS83_9ACTN|nr:BTAD domain-containing putative transcriptional regulator [Catenuloplanes nepalensis]MDP9794303.1 DNA-binding SARP family transcriptional activator [Catenuloplanes nepalensis]
MSDDSDLRVLGPLVIIGGGRETAPPRGHQERLFAALLASAGRPVPVGSLARVLWPGRPPRDPAAAIQPEVSRLRRLLAPAGAIVRYASGCYTLTAPPGLVDLCRFETLAADGRRALHDGDPARAATLLGDALALWRGPAFADLAGDPFDGARRRLDEQRLVARVELGEARLALGHHRELVSELEELTHRHPLHEALAGQLILALYRSGRQAEAMDAYHRLRRRLADDLGQDPGPDLVALYARLLGQDGALGWAGDGALGWAGDGALGWARDGALGWAGRREHRVWNLPPANPKFCGRDRVLAELTELIEPTGTVVLHGMPGIGKSQLALRYAHAAGLPAVWWCPAETPDLLDASLAALAAELGVAVAGDLDRTRAALRQALAGRTRWLLVFDNAEELGHLRHWLPATAETGRVLITSRNPDWEGYATPLAVPVFAPDESRGFLLRHADGDAGSADALADRLGNLPLALEQAAAFCRRTGDSLGSYLGFLGRPGQDMLSRGRTGDYDGTVASTLRIAFARLAGDDPRAADLLRACTFLAADNIPIRVLAAAARGPDDPLRISEAVGTLKRYSLVERRGDTVSVHRLVQELIRAGVREPVRRDTLTRLAGAGRLTAPHLAALLGHLDAAGLWPDGLADEVCRAARQLGDRGAYAAAGRLTNQALRLLERAGQDDPAGRAALLSELGEVLDQAGCDLQGAQPVLREALSILESMPGDTTVATGRTLSRLAHALHCADLTREAYDCHERALRLLRAVPDSADYGHALASFGTTLWWTRDLERSRRAFTEAIAVLEAAHGPAAPDVAVARSGLGTVLQDLGDLTGARDQLVRAVGALRAAHPDAGDAHPEIAQTLDKLGYLLRLAGDRPGALDCHRRAVRALEQLFGADDPRVAMALTNRGLDELDCGDVGAALRTQARAVAVFAAAYGARHSSTLIARTRHAVASRIAGDVQAAADALLTVAADHRATVHRRPDPDLGRTLVQLTLALRAAGRDAEAARREALAELGPDHPDARLLPAV